MRPIVAGLLDKLIDTSRIDARISWHDPDGRNREKFNLGIVSLMKTFIRALTTGLFVAVSGCAGMGASYDTPADSGQILFTVEAITPALASRLSVAPPSSVTRPSEGEGPKPFAYRLGPADVLAVYVNQSLFAESIGSGGGGAEGGSQAPKPSEALYVISEDGKIFLPLIGGVSIAGQTVGEAYQTLSAALAKFIARPQISVRVAEFRSQRVAVAGEVRTPGFVPITDRPISITEAIIGAGQTERANLRKVVLKRKGQEYVVDLFALIESPSFGQDWTLIDGDVLLVPANLNKVYVLGEAPNRAQPIDPYSTTLAEVLLGGESMSPTAQQGNYLQEGGARPGSIFVIRGNTESARVFHLNGSSPEAFILADRFQIADGDIVFVSTRGVTRFNRFIAQLLPSIQSLLLPLLVVNSSDGN